METYYDLSRFIEAQNKPGLAGYDNALQEINKGMKMSHWIWYVFPILKGIGNESLYGEKYSISGIDEAKAYMRDPTLGGRMIEVCETLLNLRGYSAKDIFGLNDASRVRSSVTLFFLASGNEVLRDVLDRYFYGRPCEETLFRLKMSMPPRNQVEEGNDRVKNEKKQVRGTIKRNQRYHYRHKLNKKKIFFASVLLLLIFFGIGSIGYVLLGNKNDNISSQTSVVNNAENSLKIELETKDGSNIVYPDIEKYQLRTRAYLGNTTASIDTAGVLTYTFNYSKDDVSDTVDVEVRIESCTIGKLKSTLRSIDAATGVYKLKLNVSRTDLRIYEELAWYINAGQTVSTKKYPLYVSRIKAISNKDFAKMLTKKLEIVK